jgi:hypothetical protein
MRRVPSQKIRTTARVASSWIAWIRLNSNPPIWKIASGKNSSIEGPWNSGGASAAKGAIRVAA